MTIEIEVLEQQLQKGLPVPDLEERINSILDQTIN